MRVMKSRRYFRRRSGPRRAHTAMLYQDAMYAQRAQSPAHQDAESAFLADFMMPRALAFSAPAMQDESRRIHAISCRRACRFDTSEADAALAHTSYFDTL